MRCAVYKSLIKSDTYLFIERKDDFSRVPQVLLDLVGRMELVMELELAPDRSLAQADPQQVRGLLVEQGYYLQLPPSAVNVRAAH